MMCRRDYRWQGQREAERPVWACLEPFADLIEHGGGCRWGHVNLVMWISGNVSCSDVAPPQYQAVSEAQYNFARLSRFRTRSLLFFTPSKIQWFPRWSERFPPLQYVLKYLGHCCCYVLRHQTLVQHQFSTLYRLGPFSFFFFAHFPFPLPSLSFLFRILAFQC